MKKLEIDNYPNLLDHININTEEIFEQLKGFKLNFFNVRNSEAEWKISFPMFLTPFYKFIYLNNSIIDQENYFQYYLSENKDYFSEKVFSQEIMEGLKARIFRTYPSLVRDFHFSVFLKENFKDAKIIYNRKLDIEEGIDILIIFNSNYFGINLYTNTTRAFIGREKKEYRHVNFDNVHYIELPVEFKGSVKCGDFFLYGEKEFNQIQTILNK